MFNEELVTARFPDRHRNLTWFDDTVVQGRQNDLVLAIDRGTLLTKFVLCQRQGEKSLIRGWGIRQTADFPDSEENKELLPAELNLSGVKKIAGLYGDGCRFLRLRFALSLIHI